MGNTNLKNGSKIIIKVIDKEGKKVWETGKTTKIPGPYSLRVTDDGVLQVLNGRKGIIWSNK